MSGCPRLPPKSRCKNQPAAAPFFVMKKEGRFPRPFNQPPIVKYQAKRRPLLSLTKLPPLFPYKRSAPLTTPNSIPIFPRPLHAYVSTSFPQPTPAISQVLASIWHLTFWPLPASIQAELPLGPMQPANLAAHLAVAIQNEPGARLLLCASVLSTPKLESLRVAVSTQSFHRTCHHLRTTPGAHFALPTHVSGLASRKTSQRTAIADQGGTISQQQHHHAFKHSHFQQKKTKNQVRLSLMWHSLMLQHCITPVLFISGCMPIVSTASSAVLARANEHIHPHLLLVSFCSLCSLSEVGQNRSLLPRLLDSINHFTCVVTRSQSMAVY